MGKFWTFRFVYFEIVFWLLRTAFFIEILFSLGHWFLHNFIWLICSHNLIYNRTLESSYWRCQKCAEKKKSKMDLCKGHDERPRQIIHGRKGGWRANGQWHLVIGHKASCYGNWIVYDLWNPRRICIYLSK